MAIYTYVVDHGDNAPSVGVRSVINGGRLQAVAFDDALAKLAAYEEFVVKLHDTTADPRTQDAIDELLNSDL